MNTIVNISVIVLIVTGPILLFWINNKSQNKKKLNVLKAFAIENNATISTYDSWNQNLIGLDNEKNMLFWIRTINQKDVRQVINIVEVKTCRMAITERKVKSTNITDQIRVIFTFHNQQPEIALEFYNTAYDQLTLSGEKQLAQKWTDIIRQKVNTIRDISKLSSVLS